MKDGYAIFNISSGEYSFKSDIETIRLTSADILSDQLHPYEKKKIVCSSPSS